jgi:autoinducer 2-degrading protein
MFSLMVALEVRPERRAEFLAGIAVNAETSVRDEPGCLRFDVCSVASDENRFVLYELYTDADAFAAHKAAPHFAQWRAIAERVIVPGGQVNTTGELLHSHTAEVAA